MSGKTVSSDRVGAKSDVGRVDGCNRTLLLSIIESFTADGIKVGLLNVN